jgi:peptide/nickel transport system permease protein
VSSSAVLSSPGVEGGLPDAAAATAPRPRRSERRWLGGLASYLLIVFVLLTLNFFLPRAMPGDPVEGLLAQGSNSFVFGEQAKTKLEEYYGLDQPLGAQYVHYLSRLAHGDLGRSIVTNAPVRKEIGRRLPWTLLLIVGSLLLSTIVGLVAGVHSGWRRDRPMDRAVMTGLVAVREFPPFLLASLMLYLFAAKLGWFPLFGGQTPFSDSFGPVERMVDIGRHMLLPLLVLTVGLTAGTYLTMRAGMVTELGSDHLLLGRAKGLRQRRLKYRYAARNALLPVVSLTAVEVGFAVTVNVLVERVFSYPGLGRLLFESIGTRDYPTIQGTFLVVSVGIVTVNALADVAYRRLDPRAAP